MVAMGIVDERTPGGDPGATNLFDGLSIIEIAA
jgi:hypothetical protein